jgi:putative Mn2+ efflux pump MntP
VFLGKKFGAVFRAKAGRANILGGVILILIGIEIFVTGLLGL